MTSETPRKQSSRAESAAATRSRIVNAAETLLLSQGWGLTTIRDIAREAQVSPESIYKGFGNKAGLFKSVYDVRIAGDHSPIPIADRENIARLRAATSPCEAANAWATHAQTIQERSAPLVALALGARATEPELDSFVRKIDTERMTGASRATAHWESLGWLQVPQPEARDRLWLLGSPSLYLDLDTLDWTQDQVHEWYRTSVLNLVLRLDSPEI